MPEKKRYAAMKNVGIKTFNRTTVREIDENRASEKNQNLYRTATGISSG